MTMPTTDDMVDPETGLPLVEVEPGSEEDPFTANRRAESSTQNQQVQQSSAEEEVPAGEAGDEALDTATAETAEDQAPTLEGRDEELTEEEAAALEEQLREFLAPYLQEEVEQVRRSMQSTYDRRIHQLQQQYQALQQQLQEREQEIRRIQLEGLPEEERQKLQQVWELEDKQRQLQQYQQELDEYYKELLISSYLLEYGQYGVTREQLEQIESPEEIEAFCLEAKANALEQALQQLQEQQSGVQQRSTRRAPQKQAVAAQQPSAPAGANAPSDVGAGAPTQSEEFVQGTGMSTLVENLRRLKWE